MSQYYYLPKGQHVGVYLRENPDDAVAKHLFDCLTDNDAKAAIAMLSYRDGQITGLTFRLEGRSSRSSHTMECSTCHNHDVKRDAWAVWNAATGEWELDNVFDDTFCEACEGQCSIIERTETGEVV